MGPYQHKIQTKEKDYLRLIEDWRIKGLEIVFTNGCFDILHSGHIQYLSEAKSLGDRLILGINTDESVRKLKGKNRPILDLEERAILLSSLEMVDLIIPFSEETPLKLIQSINPGILVKGGDYKASEVVGSEFVKQNGGRIQILYFKEGKSSSKIIDKIKSMNSHG